MKYRIGFPGWKIAAKLGVTLRVKIEIMKDSETDVFIATSPDLQGLVVEAESIEELQQEIQYCIDELLHEVFNRDVRSSPDIPVKIVGDATA